MTGKEREPTTMTTTESPTHDRSPTQPTNPDGNNQHTPVPAMFHHCNAVFDAMFQAAEAYWADLPGTHRPVKCSEATEQGMHVSPSATKVLVWEGFLTKLVGEELGLSTPYFSLVRNNLIAMQCIRQLQRGGGSSPSRWELLRPPNLEAFTTIREQTGSSYGAVSKHLQKHTAVGLATTTAQAASQAGRDNTRRIDSIEQTQAVLLDTLNSILAALETKGIEIELP